MRFPLKNNSNKPKKVNFPFRDNIIYVIHFDPPFAYIRQADKFLLSVFGNFVDEWTIEYNGAEGKVRAILVYYGLPLMKEKTPKSIIPNIEDLEKASDIEIYYYVAIQWILKYLENTQPNQLLKVIDLLRDSRGIPVKVKELEGKKIKNFTGNPKGILYDLVDIMQLSREINLEEAIPGSDKPAILRIFGFLMPKSIEQVRSILYLILIGTIFIVAFLFLRTFASTLSNIHYITFLNQTNFTNITLPINSTNSINTTYHVVNPLG
jgi:hypothetical protein